MLPHGGTYKDFAIAGLLSLLWSAALIAVFAPLVSHLYRRRTTE